MSCRLCELTMNVRSLSSDRIRFFISVAVAGSRPAVGSSGSTSSARPKRLAIATRLSMPWLKASASACRCRPAGRAAAPAPPRRGPPPPRTLAAPPASRAVITGTAFTNAASWGDRDAPVQIAVQRRPSQHLHGSAGGTQEPAQHREEGGLARAVRPDQADGRARLDRDIDAIERARPAEVAAEAHRLDDRSGRHQASRVRNTCQPRNAYSATYARVPALAASAGPISGCSR